MCNFCDDIKEDSKRRDFTINAIYYKDNYYDMVINVDKNTRKQNKIVIIDKLIEKLGELLWGEGLIK